MPPLLLPLGGVEQLFSTICAKVTTHKTKAAALERITVIAAKIPKDLTLAGT